MLAEIPRKPIFPEHMIVKVIQRLERDVQEDVIPVSTGIYSQHKLNEKLQAIPKPTLVDYEDTIFYDLISASSFPCKSQNCTACGQEYGNKKNFAVQCKFCGIWNCSECICLRKRYHPRSKQSNSERFDICHRCDDKFLSLQLHHGYVESRSLLEEVMKRTRKEKDQVERQCDRREHDSNYAKDQLTKGKFKISSLKKEQIDLGKNISRIQLQTEEQRLKLKVREKYLAILMKKKEKVRERADQEARLNEIESEKPVEQVKPVKVVRQLKSTNVVSQTIKVERESKDMQETTYSGQDQFSASSPVEEKTIPSPKEQEPALNFYNFYEWNKPQQEYSQQDEKVVEKNQIANEEKNKQEQAESEVQIIQEEPVVSTEKQHRLAQIFGKVQQKQEEYDDSFETESLKSEVINARKAELMRAAIERSHLERLSMEEDTPTVDRRACACLIY